MKQESADKPGRYFWCSRHNTTHRQGDDKRDCLLVGPFSTKSQAAQWPSEVPEVTPSKRGGCRFYNQQCTCGGRGAVPSDCT